MTVTERGDDEIDDDEINFSYLPLNYLLLSKSSCSAYNRSQWSFLSVLMNGQCWWTLSSKRSLKRFLLRFGVRYLCVCWKPCPWERFPCVIVRFLAFALHIPFILNFQPSSIHFYGAGFFCKISNISATPTFSETEVIAVWSYLIDQLIERNTNN